MPKRVAPTKTLLRVRLPDGWKVDSAKAGDRAVPVQGETLDLTGLTGEVSVTAAVSKK